MRNMGAFVAALVLAAGLPGVPLRAAAPPESRPVPTHADAAVILAKFSGLFDRYVQAEATLGDCVAFLNSAGIYFGLMEVVNGKEFTLKDCARVMGQAELVLSGEAAFDAGKVKLPKGIASWEDFCTMNAINFMEVYGDIVKTVGEAVKKGQ